MKNQTLPKYYYWFPFHYTFKIVKGICLQLLEFINKITILTK